MKHTELPIIYIPSEATHTNGKCFDLISNPDSNSFYYLGEISEEANAAFIVKAVNSHEKLLDALKELHSAASWIDDASGFDDALRKAREAIKEAE